MAAKIKKGDKVVVLAGKDKGKTGEVLQVIPNDDRALVQGINLVRRHTKQTAERDAGIYYQGSADPYFEHRACRSQGRQADPRRLSRSRTAKSSASPSVPEK